MKKKLLDIVRDKIRFKHYSLSTEKTYIFWIKHYIFFHQKRHPIDLGKKEIEDFLTFLAMTKKVSSTTQNQAFLKESDAKAPLRFTRVLCCSYTEKFWVLT